MPRLKVAHIREQGQNLIIVPLETTFSYESNVQQQRTHNEIQTRATAAGLAGSVALVWERGDGHMGFRAHKAQHSYYATISYQYVWANVNKEISW